MSGVTQVEHRFETFSVGVKPDVNDQRRHVFDAVAILAGRKSRLENHTFCFERLICSIHELMMQSPGIFAQLFGDGGGDADAQSFNEKRFAAFVARLQGDSTGGRRA
jgi:hypothetical protein